MITLGINAAFHDSAACLVKDGKVLAAAEEERFTHVKHGKRPVPFTAYELPFHAIDFCLKTSGIRLAEVDHVAYSYNPELRSGGKWDSPWDPLFLSYIRHAPLQLRDGAPHHLKSRFGKNGNYAWHFVDHHVAHAASAFFASPFESAAIMTLDGRGEKTTTGYAIGKGTGMQRIAEVEMPHSLGMLYERITDYLGFLHSSDEYKVMALASFGKPKYLEDFRQMIRLNGNGFYEIDWFDFEDRFGPARVRNGPYEEKHYDIAHSLQKFLEETVLHLARWLHDQTREENLCMAGGVALNCVMNARLRDEGPFKKIWVQPAAGDAGTALGAALWIDAQQNESRNYVMDHVFLGPEYTDQEIEEFLVWTKVPYKRLNAIAEETAEILAQNAIIGWFQGRMEFGPRALGARSILASPIHPKMQDWLNEIKDREDFRPVAPVVLEEEAANWFKGADFSPFMLFVYDVLPDKAGKIPAVRHVDGTARVQTINRSQNPRYYDLIQAFHKKTGVPVLVNTSFNTRGEPIVCTPRDAVECFWTSPLDYLIIGSFLLKK